MAISSMPMSPTQNGGLQFNMPTGSQAPTGFPSLNLPGISTGSVDPAKLSTSPNQVYSLLAQQPQSLTSAIAPLLQQVFGTQANLMAPLFAQQGQAGASIAQSDAMKRGITGSSIEESGIQQAYGQANSGYAQYLAGQLNNMVPAYTNAAQFDIGQGQQYYSNLAQAVGQQYASQIQQQQFAQQLQELMGQARMTSDASIWSGAFQGLGALGGGIFSDLRLKDDVKIMGVWRDLPMYTFKYRTHPKISLFELPPGPRVGFLAHDVARVRPDCVTVDRGYLKVDYAKLFGLKLKTMPRLAHA